ncbi:MAG: SfiI family type II restriction endonuclease, partial [Candidatus Acidiferrum sp.]
MFTNPSELDPEKIEQIEKASARLVTQAIYEFKDTTSEIFSKERDQAQDIAEDVTREALDRLGVSRMDLRLFGKIDYKRARYVFHPEYAVRQALLVDSKA